MHRAGPLPAAGWPLAGNGQVWSGRCPQRPRPAGCRGAPSGRSSRSARRGPRWSPWPRRPPPGRPGACAPRSK